MNVETFLKEYAPEDEKPLDRLVTDGGMCGIFRTIGCVGDSLSSGEFEAWNDRGEKVYIDTPDYSWGQNIARTAGCKVYNFSRGGMTAKEYMTDFAEQKGFWAPELSCQAYIIAMGVNDLLNQHQEIGSVADICDGDYTQNKPTFAGYYAMIIQRLKQISPDARFFLMSMPRHDPDPEERAVSRRAFAELLYAMAEHFEHTYVLDLYRYGPVQDDEYRRRFYLGNHLNPSGYILTSRIVMSYLDYLIRHNPDEFREAGFIGTPYRYQR